MTTKMKYFVKEYNIDTVPTREIATFFFLHKRPCKMARGKIAPSPTILINKIENNFVPKSIFFRQFCRRRSDFSSHRFTRALMGGKAVSSLFLG